MKDKFIKGARRALKDAQEDWQGGRFESCVINCHLVTEYVMKVMLLSEGSDIIYRGFKDLMNELRKSNILSDEEYGKLDNLRKFRNKIYHEAHIPTKEEAQAALKSAEKIAEKVLREKAG